MPTPTPAAPSLNAIPGESVSQYETRLGSQGNTGAGSTGTGAGFGTPVPAQPVTDLDTAHDEVAKQLGFNSYQEALQKLGAPSQDTTDFYNSAYKAAGLDTLQASINQRNSDLNTALGKINDNPWLDEGSRVGRSQTLQTLAQGDIKNLNDEYNAKLQGVHDLVSNHDADVKNNQTKLDLLESQAKDLAAQAATKTRDDETAPTTIKGANGETYQWNPSTKSFTQIIPGKSPTPTGKPTPEAVSKITSVIQSIIASGQAKGQKDSFISPNDWSDALAEWTSAGYSTADFIKNFKGYANTKDPTNHYEGLN